MQGPKQVNDRIQELTELLGTCRKLSHILIPEELYLGLGDIIVDKFKAGSFAIFLYQPKNQLFSQAFVFGKTVSSRKIGKQELGPIGERLMQAEPFTPSEMNDPSGFKTILQETGLLELNPQIFAPLVMREKFIGFFIIGPGNTEPSYSANDRFFIQQIADQAAVCIHSGQLYLKRQKEKEDLDRTLYNLSLLYSIGRAMTYISDLKSLLEYILNQAIEITGAEKGNIMLYDLEKNQLSIRVMAGLRDKAFQRKVNNNEIECRSFKPGEGIAGRVFQSGKPMVVDKAGDDELFVEPDTSYVKSIVCIPMMVYSDVIGVINVTNKMNENGFTEEDVELLKAVADQAAVAINKAQLWEMAVTDGLTGLYVRRYFMVKFQEELHRAERYNKALSIVMCDLDHFKRINDSFGHTVGDRVLKAVGRFLQNNIRDVDIIARYGGEEFVILLPEAEKEEAFTVSERLRNSLADMKIDGLPQMTVSLGIASYPEDGESIDLIIKQADTALYAAKQTGRNRVVKYGKPIEPKIIAHINGPEQPDIEAG
jgi:diguanylate cyclase (GGDEF)-like protein